MLSRCWRKSLFWKTSFHLQYHMESHRLKITTNLLYRESSAFCFEKTSYSLLCSFFDDSFSLVPSAISLSFLLLPSQSITCSYRFDEESRKNNEVLELKDKIRSLQLQLESKENMDSREHQSSRKHEQESNQAVEDLIALRKTHQQMINTMTAEKEQLVVENQNVENRLMMEVDRNQENQRELSTMLELVQKQQQEIDNLKDQLKQLSSSVGFSQLKYLHQILIFRIFFFRKKK